MKILVTNDDGYQSTGIDALAQCVQSIGEIKLVTSNTQRTATSKGMTFNTPLRIFDKKTQSGLDVNTHTGFPADSLNVYTFLYNTLPELVVSGINGGENTSSQGVLTSGTCGIAIEAGLRGIPSFAISVDVPQTYFFTDNYPFEFEKIRKICKEIITNYLKLNKEFWKETLFINVNFPKAITDTTQVETAELAKLKYLNYLKKRKDLKGEYYYWQWGTKKRNFDKTTDTYKLQRNIITVTPVTLGSKKSILNMADKATQNLSIR